MNKKFFAFCCLIFGVAGVGVWLIIAYPLPENSKGIGQAALINQHSIVIAENLSQSQTEVKVQSLPASEDFSKIGEVSYGTVKRTVDGDTLDVIINGKEEKVRLLGMNTPETVDPRRTVECFGKEASHQMDTLVSGQKITLVSDFTNDNRDKYKRLLRYVYKEDGTFVNAWMVEQGYAFAYLSFPFVHKKEFIALERKARDGELGLWNSSVCPYYKTTK